MGAIAEGIAAYMQPLFEQTDGSDDADAQTAGNAPGLFFIHQ